MNKNEHPLAWGSEDGPKQDTGSLAFHVARERREKIEKANVFLVLNRKTGTLIDIGQLLASHDIWVRATKEGDIL